MASEIRVDKITSLSGVGTISPSPTGVEIAGITTAATLKATTGIVTTLTATTGIVTSLTTNTLTANSTTKVGSGVTLSPDGDIFATGITTFTGELRLTEGTSSTSNGDEIGSLMYLHPASNNKNAKIVSLMNGGSSGADLAFFTRTQADGTNTDGGEERVRITSSGDVGIGVTNPEVDLHVKGNLLVQNTIGNHLTVRSTVSNGNDPNFRFEKGRGGGTPAIVQNGDDCGELSWRGYDGDSYETGASILCEVDDTPSDGDMPMRMTFKTRSAGAGNHQGRLRIHADGLVSLENNSNFQIPDKIIHDGDTDTAIRFPAADTISFETGGTERARFNSNGLCLGGTGAANGLDDYEFGDWTPKQTDGGTNYTANHAKYVKIGSIVHITFDITSSSATNLTQIWNLPFTPADYSSWSTAYYAVNANTTGTGTAGYSNTRHGGLVVPSGGGYLHTRILGGTVTWNITNTDRLIGSATYKTTA